MPKDHKIAWTEKTWNPVRGCSRISPGCVNCYAERMAARNLPGMKSPTTGEPFAIMTDSGPRWTGKLQLIESKLEDPLHWKKPRRVFVNSMSDLFHENLPYAAIARVYAPMYRAHWHTYQILTKRSERRREAFADPVFWEMVSHYAGAKCLPGAPQIWEGVSIENKQTADERIPELLRTPAAVRFVSYEPALEYVDLRPYLSHLQTFRVSDAYNSDWIETRRLGLDWVILGGESGPGARPFDIEAARFTVENCQEAGVPIFVKQLGSKPVRVLGKYVIKLDPPLKDRKGGDMSEWPEKLRVREYPTCG